MLGIDILKLMGSSGASGGSGGGGGGGSVTFTSTTISGANDALFTIDSDGFVYKQSHSTPPAASYAWITPQVGMNQYEARATLLDGNIPGVMDTWSNLGLDISWGWLAQSTPKTASIKIEIRKISGGAIVATATVNLDAGT